VLALCVCVCVRFHVLCSCVGVCCTRGDNYALGCGVVCTWYVYVCIFMHVCMCLGVSACMCMGTRFDMKICVVTLDTCTHMHTHTTRTQSTHAHRHVYNPRTYTLHNHRQMHTFPTRTRTLGRPLIDTYTPRRTHTYTCTPINTCAHTHTRRTPTRHTHTKTCARHVECMHVGRHTCSTFTPHTDRHKWSPWHTWTRANMYTRTSRMEKKVTIFAHLGVVGKKNDKS